MRAQRSDNVALFAVKCVVEEKAGTASPMGAWHAEQGVVQTAVTAAESGFLFYFPHFFRIS